jgi:hypothetical protein
MIGIDHQPGPGMTRVLCHHLGPGDDLDALAAATHLNGLANPSERHRVLPALEADQTVRRDGSGHGLVEGLGQVRHCCQMRLLGLPAIVDALAGGRTAPPAGALQHTLVGEGLQFLQAIPGSRLDLAAAAACANQTLDLALVLRRIRQTSIDVETNRCGVAPIGRVDLAPGTGAVTDGGLGIVDPHHGRNTAQALKGAVMTP